MDEFSKLSLADPSTVQEEDLQAILSLTICEDGSKSVGNKSQLSQKIMDKFMPHVPSSPSPLRQALLVDDTHDEMDIDLIEDSATEVPGRDSASIENDLLHESETEEVEPAQTASPNSRAVIKALLSPTKLGVAAATKLDDYSSEPSAPETRPANCNQTSHLQKSAEITGVELPQETLETLRQRSQYSPIQISINNNHYYYPPEPQYVEEDNHQRRSLKLPDPWSPQSHPASRGSYLFTSYLQIFLNLLTALICFSFVMIFMRAIKADLKSEWQTTKLELDHESRQCRVYYNANKCERATRVPALEKQCDDWEKCMGRNNDLFFRARSAISARLIGDTLNSFIEPLGWKTLGVVLAGLAIWCFSSNFILGFARAKSYYGDEQNQRPPCCPRARQDIPTGNLLQNDDKLQE
ncbi:LAQU0S11e02850g1_1 [Lachancea quebecensis]|uniref:LAQU0S11e02850g1_1 n=1 Tax=Lachancea quebecensis TaxID=1654605 RepID=A0A0P1KU04_9SACH|nr:LAQU0S11e02850g1_1 [Lachancea quebecensis]